MIWWLKIKRKIVFLTGTRADFGKLRPLIEIVNNSNEFECHIFVTGMHLIKKYGYTINEIKKQTKVNMTDLNEKLGIEVKIPDPLKRRVATRQYSNRTRNYSSQVSRKRMSARNRYDKRKKKIQPITRSYFSSKKRW